VQEAQEGTPYVSLTDRQEETGEIPDSLHRLVECYSLNRSHYGAGAKTSRERGEYRLRSAKATVTRNDSGYHSIEARGTVAKDVIDLTSRIVAGTIAPVRTHERAQVKAGLPGLREALHQLIDAAARAFDNMRLA
jgi:hypothetical protein